MVEGRWTCVYVKISQGGEGLQCVEGSGGDCGQLVVVQRQQSHVVEPRKTVVMDTADLVVPQHPKREMKYVSLKSEIFP